jgi:hypothetical protein
MAKTKAQTDSNSSAGSGDESIGRPPEWREGRYERRGAPIDQSVNKPSQTDDEPHDTVGTQTPPATGTKNSSKPPSARGQRAVTRKDYE